MRIQRFIPLLLFESSDLDLDIDTGRQFQLHQRVYRFACRVENIDQPLVRTGFELFTRLLIHVRRTIDRVDAAMRRQRDRAGDNGARRTNGLDDLLGRLVDQIMVERL